MITCDMFSLFFESSSTLDFPDEDGYDSEGKVRSISDFEPEPEELGEQSGSLEEEQSRSNVDYLTPKQNIKWRHRQILSDKDIKKKPRGFAQEVCSTDGDGTVVKWLDNKPANLASNFIGIGEKDLVKRWSKTEKKFIEFERPEIVRKYNHAMGGVDLLDQLMSYYRTFIKSKKWPLRMIFHESDLAVVQAFRDYNIDNDLLGIPKAKRLSLLRFRRRLSDALITPRRPGEVRPSIEVARDGVGHFTAHDGGSGTRCKLVGCKGKSRIKCVKCKVHLCFTKDKNCFLVFHS
ncbi:unnamed protein product [Parnassius mnemosyne]|uniref:PiggyBac transposable element-derived protein domain-containing protein n=1 Tax=Parnassius mnemosyne TaxID=213953 RepID=A0AAV1KUI9_9NEOP